MCDGVECSGFDCFGCRDPDYPDYDCTDVAMEKPDSLVYQGKVPTFHLMGILCEKGISSFAYCLNSQVFFKGILEILTNLQNGRPVNLVI